MDKRLWLFSINEITRTAAHTNVFVGNVDFQFEDEIDGREYHHTLSVKVRVKGSDGDSIAALEEKFLSEARGLIDLTDRLLSKETRVSLQAASAAKFARLDEPAFGPGLDIQFPSPDTHAESERYGTTKRTPHPSERK